MNNRSFKPVRFLSLLVMLVAMVNVHDTRAMDPKMAGSFGEKFGQGLIRGLGSGDSGFLRNALNSASKAFSDFLQQSDGSSFVELANTLGRGVSQFKGRLGESLDSANVGLATQLTENLDRNFAELERGVSEKVIPRFNNIAHNFSYNIMHGLDSGVKSVWNMRNGLVLSLPVVVGISAVSATGLFWLWARKRVSNPKPTVLLPGANIGRLDRVQRWWAGYRTPSIVFPEKVKDRLIEISVKTQNIIKHRNQGKKVSFDNLLLYGAPGTGKTLFAKVLADKTNMDFAPTTAGALLQPDVGVQYINELISMAQKSKYGVIIFIDEADALFADRNSLSVDSDHYKVLNHLLALTGEGSDKFMLVAATNHKSVIDGAMARRFQDCVNMPLPEAGARKELIELYVNKVLFNVKDNGQSFVNNAKSLLNNAQIDVLVQDTEGFSSADIKDIVQAMRKKASATDSDVLTIKHINSAVSECIEKKRAFEEVVDY